MTSNQKRRLFRLLAVAAVIVLVLTGSFTVSHVQGLGYRKLLGEVPAGKAGRLPAAQADAADPAGFTAAGPDAQAVAGYTRQAENESLVLFFREDTGAVKLYDKRASRLWAAVVEDEELLSAGLTEAEAGAMQSMMVFNYIDLGNSSPVERTAYSHVEQPSVESQTIKSGVRVTYDYAALNITIRVDYTLNGPRLSVHIPDEGIRESENAEDGEALKKQVQTAIQSIDADLKKVIALANADSDNSDNKKTLIQMTAADTVNNLNNQYKMAQSGSYDSEVGGLIADNVDRLISMLEEDAEAASLLQSIRERAAKAFEDIIQVTRSRSTGIVTLQMMPYFGAQRSSADGYVFFPDRCGSLSYFGSQHPRMAGVYQQDVYAVFAEAEVRTVSEDELESGYTSAVSLPVYGVKSGAAAFLAILEDGAANSSLAYTPCEGERDIANICAVYNMRKRTVIIGGGGPARIVDNRRTRSDWSTLYTFLQGESADYSGMAVAYRGYLEQTGGIARSSLLDGDMPVGLEFFIGAENKQQSTLREYVPMTSFAYIEEYLKRLDAAGAGPLAVNLNSWTARSGAKNPDALKPAGPAGGKAALKSLCAYAAEKKLLVGANVEMAWGDGRDMPSSEVKAAGIKNKGLLTYESFGWHLLNPFYTYHKFDRITAPALRSLGLTAVQTESISGNLVYDYNPDAYCERGDTAAVYAALCGNAQKALGGAFASEANAYLFTSVDWNMDVSDTHSAFLYADESVPFYQMVTHGYIPYTGEGFNYMYDKTEQRLRSIEYGYLPYYFLTENEPFELRTAGYDGFFSTVADNWFDDIVATAAQYRRDFSGLWKARIIRHERPTADTAVTTYEDGTRVAVNYGGAPAVVAGATVEAGGYAVLAGEPKGGGV